jgi:hypothetical protein
MYDEMASLDRLNEALDANIYLQFKDLNMVMLTKLMWTTKHLGQCPPGCIY